METRKRKRGIRASREKLELAMINVGLKTQNALAQQIAQNENIEKPPKDLVSKVFNEKPVSVANLARVAKALNVESHAIYLAKDDHQVSSILQSQQSETFVQSNKSIETLATDIHETKKPPNFKLKNNLVIPMIGLLLLTVIGIWWWNAFNGTHVFNNASVAPLDTKISSPLGKVLIVVQSPPETSQLARLLLQDLTSQTNISVILPERPDSYQLSNADSLSQWQAHGVLRMSVNTGEFYDFVNVEFASKVYTKTLGQFFFSADEFASHNAEIATIISEQVTRFINGQILNPIYSDSKEALFEYFAGVNQLFVSHSASEYAIAETHFRNATALDPKFSQAYAQKCKTKVRESWIKDEVTLLEAAAIYCKTAENLAPEDVHTLLAKSELLSRTGEPRAAITLARNILDHRIVSADAKAILAELLMVQSKTSDEDQINSDIVKFAKQAIALEKRHWRAYNTLGNFYFNKGQIDIAKNQFEQASKIVVHEVIMGNLGTMQMCFDELESAESTYRKLIASFENNALGHENLGTVFLFQQQYQKALEQKLIAIKKQPEISIHQVWSGLAEAYLRISELDKAYENYVNALTIIERDELLNNASFADGLFKLYYKVKLQSIAPEKQLVSDYIGQTKTFYEERGQMGLKARSHLAWLAGTLGQSAEKANLLKEITSVCPVYLRSPELLDQP
ncbi:tetratricopeptide repeat protein [Glaciecola petra]|uniref:Uncharacterized protein n=1 Tax=Glaciecola petra TaxID=3075602 RepID=A0ABU2ZQQ5_9ALTE|nr:hypothetical protein [Aestuariibacter sp. P117]MDT0594955.1 hypothetical protein [Aestuariibacter sp. P117]